MIIVMQIIAWTLVSVILGKEKKNISIIGLLGWAVALNDKNG